MPEDKDTLLLLPGDVHNGRNVVPFISEMAGCFAHVIFVPGNHEFYFGDILKTVGEIKDELDYVPNVTVLDNETVEIGGIRFIGSTLWSDMDRSNPVSMMDIERSLNDYGLIQMGEKTLRAPHSIMLFQEAREFLEEELEKEHQGQTIVVTHHAPSFKSIHPLYRESNINGAFCSDLEHLLHYFDISYWFHGHTHQTVHYEIEGTKVRNNPRGYGDAENLHFDPTFRVAV
jgi:Icc-related predicted phosphoesterase